MARPRVQPLPGKVRLTRLSVVSLAWAVLRRELKSADYFLSTVTEERTLNFIKVCEVYVCKTNSDFLLYSITNSVFLFREIQTKRTKLGYCEAMWFTWENVQDNTKSLS